MTNLFEALANGCSGLNLRSARSLRVAGLSQDKLAVIDQLKPFRYSLINGRFC
jgi:hypothetical protein